MGRGVGERMETWRAEGDVDSQVFVLEISSRPIFQPHDWWI